MISISKGVARELSTPATPFLFVEILHVKSVLLESLQVRIVERYVLRQRRSSPRFTLKIH